MRLCSKENVSVKTVVSENLCYILPSVHTVTSSAVLHRSTSRDRSSVSKMGIWLSWKLIVASILCLTISLPSSEFSDPLTDPASPDPREDKPPIKISSVQFEFVCVHIYDSQTIKNSKKIYFYSPMALLNHKNVASIHNTPSLSVSFAIWNQEVRANVTKHLSQLLSQQIEPSQVKIFPFDSVRLTSKVQSADFSLTNEWLPYDNQPSLRFTLICPTREDCGRVKTQMQNFPKQFEHLQLEFNPNLNDDDCVNDGVGISKENKLPAQDKETMANFEAKFAKELIAIREETKKELAAISQMFSDKIKVTEENLAVVQQKFEISQKELEATKTLLTSTRIELSQTKSTIDGLARELNARTSELIDIGRMPTSCEDLQRMGQKVNGFFSVKGSKKMEMIYCNFNANQNDKQKWIGYVGVKSVPVHFYVQRNSLFNSTGTPIPFRFARVNEENAMNLTSGKFTAPRPGIYFFSFAGVARLERSSSVDFFSNLYLNGNLIGSSNVNEDNGPVNQYSPLTLQSTLNLNKGDQVWLEINYYGSSSYLYDSSSHYTHFTGFLLEEEIVASL
ncbi:uncharacterized protein LOC124203522 [Daphnia pulex]|uniref:uncharacterized protein LOC124203522 n=1 Tax=Daphnia pulex TaxID=6669 RepID=UPI001EDD2A28|nr:uncharacterized protein LOC124203522 [Daphnia pulex]